MPPKSKFSNKLALWNDNKLFSYVWTAGTDLKQYRRLTEKNESDVKLIELSKFVHHLVVSRGLPLAVTSKIARGITEIYLLTVQTIHRSLLVINKPEVNLAVSYRKQNIVRKIELEESRELDTILNMELDYLIKPLSENEIIECLKQNQTTVQNLEDITLREVQTTTYEDRDLLANDDFGGAPSEGMLNFFKSSDTDNDIQMDHELPNMQDMNIDMTVGTVDEMANVANCPYNDAALEEELPRLAVETIMQTDQENNVSTEYNESMSIREVNENDRSVQSAHEENYPSSSERMNIRQDGKNTLKKRRLIIDHRIIFNFECHKRWISRNNNLAKNPNSIREELALCNKEHNLENMFAEPLRFSRVNLLRKQSLKCLKKRKQVSMDFDALFNVKKICKTATDNVTSCAIRLNHYEAQNIVPASIDAMHSTNVAGQHQVVFTALGPTDNADNQPEGSVTTKAMTNLLRSMWTTGSNDSIPIKEIRILLENQSRLIAASVFAKLLILAAKNIIRLEKDENGNLCSLQKGSNWT